MKHPLLARLFILALLVGSLGFVPSNSALAATTSQTEQAIPATTAQLAPQTMPINTPPAVVGGGVRVEFTGLYEGQWLGGTYTQSAGKYAVSGPVCPWHWDGKSIKGGYLGYLAQDTDNCAYAVEEST